MALEIEFPNEVEEGWTKLESAIFAWGILDVTTDTLFAIDNWDELEENKLFRCFLVWSMVAGIVASGLKLLSKYEKDEKKKLDERAFSIMIQGQEDSFELNVILCIEISRYFYYHESISTIAIL